MYRQFYNLRLNSFKIEPDPEFLWLGEKHREGIATLQYGILETKGFILLTGDVGTGKTVLSHQLRKTLPAQVKVSVIQDPGIEVLDLYRILSEDFEITGLFEGKANFLKQFKRFLIDAYAAKQQLLIIIDEAHRLSCELLDAIRVLSNIDYDNRLLVNVFFVGQGEFNRILMNRRNQAVRQRIAVSYHLSPLDEQETQAYIRHRLKVAGSEKDLFTSEALREIYRLTGGTPRLINVVCDRSLVAGYVYGLEQIGAETIRECAIELDVTLGIPRPVNGRGSKASNHARVPEIIRSKLRARGSKVRTLSARLSAFASRALQPKRFWQRLLDHSAAWRAHCEGIAIGLRPIISVGRAYSTITNHIRLIVAKSTEGDAPDEPRRRSSPWATAARVGVLGFLLYLPFWTRSLLDMPLATVQESTGGQITEEHKSPTNSPAPMQSEGLSAKKTRPPSDSKDPTPAALGPVATALAQKGKMDQPAVVIHKRDPSDPWENILFLTLGFFLWVLSKSMKGRFRRSDRPSPPMTLSLLEHSVALREHFEELFIRLRRIVGVRRAYETVINKIHLIVAHSSEGEVPDKHRRRSSLWATAALVGVLGFLLSLSFWTRSSVDIHEDSAAAVKESTGGRKPAEYRSPTNSQAPTRSEGLPQVQKFYLLFKSGSAALEDESFKALTQVSQLLSTHPNSRITLTLFFDPTAKSGYASKLLGLRLDGIKSFLAGQGVEADLRVFGSSGESFPEINKPPGTRGLESWSEIRIDT